MATLTNPGSRVDLLLTLGRLALPDAVKRGDQAPVVAIGLALLYLVVATVSTLGLLPLPVGYRDLYVLRLALSLLGYWLVGLGPAAIYMFATQSGGPIHSVLAAAALLALVLLLGRVTAILIIAFDQLIESLIGLLGVLLATAGAIYGAGIVIGLLEGETEIEAVAASIRESAILSGAGLTPPGLLIVLCLGYAAAASIEFLLGILGAVFLTTILLNSVKTEKPPPICQVWRESLTLPLTAFQIFRIPARVPPLLVVPVALLATGVGLAHFGWSAWQLGAVAVLFFLPVLLLLADGAYSVWRIAGRTGHGLLIASLSALATLLAAVLARRAATARQRREIETRGHELLLRDQGE